MSTITLEEKLDPSTITHIQKITFPYKDLNDLLDNLNNNFIYFATQAILYKSSSNFDWKDAKTLSLEQETLISQIDLLLSLYNLLIGNKRDPNDLIKVAGEITKKVKEGSIYHEIIFQFIAKIIYLCNQLTGSNKYNIKPIWDGYITKINNI